MNRKDFRAAKKAGKKLMKSGWNAFEDITDESIKNSRLDRTKFPDRIWQNNIYIVQVFLEVNEWGLMEKTMIRRNDTAPIHDWKVFQRIKNEIFGEERTALEVYPRESNLIDVANIYWLWVLPDDYDCPIETPL